MMTKLFGPTFLCLSLLYASPTYSEYLSGFGATSVNFIIPSEGTRERSPYVDLTLVSIHGGANFDWGEMVGAIGVYYVDKDSDRWTNFTKGHLAYKTGLGESRLYAFRHTIDGPGFSIDDTAFGMSYNFSGDGWFLKPWAGALLSTVNQTSDTFTGFNGGIAGYTAGYTFEMHGEDFRIVNWSETEFARRQTFTDTFAETSKASLNGALSIWWLTNSELSMAIQYRYIYNDLLLPVNTNAMIYTIQYHF